MCSTRILFLLVIGIFILQMIQIMIFIRQLMILLLSSICSLLMICYHLMIRNTYRVIWATSAHITSISCIKFVTQCHRLRSSCWWHSGKLAIKLRQRRLDRPPLLMRRLQSNLNAAVWLIFNLHRSNHVSDALISLHWLRVPERIRSKVTVLVYKVLHCCALSYLGPFTYVGNLPSRRGFRSSAATASFNLWFTIPLLAAEHFRLLALTACHQRLLQHCLWRPSALDSRRPCLLNHILAFGRSDILCLHTVYSAPSNVLNT